MIKIHKVLFAVSLIIAVAGAYLFISSDDKMVTKSLLIAGVVGQVYHLIAFRMMSRKQAAN